MQDKERYVVTWSWKLGSPKIRNTDHEHSFQVKDRYPGICRVAGTLGGASVVLFKEFIPNLILRLLIYFACFFSLDLLANWLLYCFLLYQNHRDTLEKYIEPPDDSPS